MGTLACIPMLIMSILSRDSTDLLAAIHNSGGMNYHSTEEMSFIVVIAVYTQRLTEMLQVLAGPIIQALEEEIALNTKTLIELDLEKNKLHTLLGLV